MNILKRKTKEQKSEKLFLKMMELFMKLTTEDKKSLSDYFVQVVKCEERRK